MESIKIIAETVEHVVTTYLNFNNEDPQSC